ncbi:MAG: hypothetical protein ABJL99_00070 [Aliishimia sp.]
MNIEITPIQISHIASFHKAVDTVAKERKYLIVVSNAMEAPVSRNWKGYWQRAA